MCACLCNVFVCMRCRCARNVVVCARVHVCVYECCAGVDQRVWRSCLFWLFLIIESVIFVTYIYV